MNNKKPPFQITNAMIHAVAEIAELVGKLIDKGFAAGFPLGRYYADRRDQLLVAVTEKRSREEIKALANK